MDNKKTVSDSDDSNLVKDIQNINEQPNIAPNEPVRKKINKKLKIYLLIITLILITSSSILYFYSTNKHNDDINPALDTSKSTTEGNKFVVNSNNKFAFDLYSEINDNSNVFYSPYSISSAMAILYEGAKGDTASEIQSTFHYPNSETLKQNYSSIINNLNKQNDNYELKTSNALWYQNNHQLSSSYIDSASKYYGAKITGLDFKNKPQESIKTINDYVSSQTNDKIKNIIGNVEDTTRLIITNAIYFKSSWLKEFDKTYTTKQDFKITDKNVSSVDMMSMYGESFNYYGDDKLQIIEIPYKDNQLSMLVVLPKDNLNSIKSLLNSGQIDKYKTQMTTTKINYLKLPKAKFETSYDLIDHLENLGTKTVFTDHANLSGITSNEQLYVSSIKHKAYIDIDEKGTEAAAATSISSNATGGPSTEEKPVVNFIADHPYIFLIQENKSGNILFLGKVNNPTK